MISRDSPILGLIVTTGCQRSGTTLLHRLLSGHPRIHSVMTDWGVVYDKYDYLAKLTGIRQPTSQQEMIKVLDTLLNHSHFQKWGLKVDDVAEFVDRFDPNWDGVFLSMVAAAQNANGNGLVALKRPESEEHLPRLKTLFDEIERPIRFIYCVRHPFDVYLSWKHRAYCWEGRDAPDTQPIVWCSNWLNSVFGILCAQFTFPDHVRVVRFEDLTANPREEVSQLCKFLGLQDCAEQMIEHLDEYEPESSFKDTADMTRVAGGIRDVVSRPRHGLEAAEADVICQLCGPRASMFGYDLGAPQRDRRRHLMYQMQMETVPTTTMLRNAARIIFRRMWFRFASRKRQAV
jgi:hypothetical protein